MPKPKPVFAEFHLVRRVFALLFSVVIPILAAWLIAKPLHRRLTPPSEAERLAAEPGYGPISLQLRLPGVYALVPEPLFVCGVPGRATLAFIRFYDNSRAKVGVEFWGKGSFESDLFAIPYGPEAQIRVKIDLPVLYPPEGDRYWRGRSAGEQAAKRKRFTILVDGISRLSGPIDYDQPPDSPKYFGVNVVGGSLVSDRFVGGILHVNRGD